LPSNTEVKSVVDAIKTWYAEPNKTDSPTSLVLILTVIVGVAIILGAIFAYRKLSPQAKSLEVET
jgi:maltodextrin utilization protein YvdJ